MYYIKDNSEAGVALIIVFFVMIMIVASVLFTSLFLYNRITLIANMSNSVASFYLADSGIEKVFYYDRNVIPVGGTRGLCAMCANNGSCAPGGSFLNCNCQPEVAGSSNPVSGCNLTTCDDCQVSFETSYEDKKYSVKATVFPAANPSDITIQSLGIFNNIARQIEVFILK